MPPDQLAVYEKEGAALTLDQAVAYALDVGDVEPQEPESKA